MDDDEFKSVNESPVNPIPPLVIVIFLAIIGIEAAFSLGTRGLVGGPGAVGWRLEAVQRFGFSGDVFDWMVTNNRWPLEHVIRFVTYPFIHGNLTHALIAGVMLLALGKMVGEVFSWWALLAVFVVSSVAGALAYGLLLNDPIYLIGAFPPVYGLIGAFSYVMWLRLGETGAQQARAFTLIGLLLGLQLLFGLVTRLMTDWQTSNDWLADLAGFAAGFLLSFFVSPGGWSKIRAKLRHA